MGINGLNVGSDIRRRITTILADHFDDGNQDQGDILDRINEKYLTLLPILIPGDLYEDEWTFRTVAGQDVYPFPSHMLYPEEGNLVWRDRVQIKTFTRPDVFWWEFDRQDLGNAAPYGALFRGRNVTLRRIPDIGDGVATGYLISIPAKFAPATTAALTAGDDVETNLGNALIHFVAFELASELGDREILSREAQLADYWRMILRRKHLGRPRSRKIRRSY